MTLDVNHGVRIPLRATQKYNKRLVDDIEGFAYSYPGCGDLMTVSICVLREGDWAREEEELHDPLLDLTHNWGDDALAVLLWGEARREARLQELQDAWAEENERLRYAAETEAAMQRVG